MIYTSIPPYLESFNARVTKYHQSQYTHILLLSMCIGLYVQGSILIPPEVTLIYLGVALPIIGLTHFKMSANKKKIVPQTKLT